MNVNPSDFSPFNLGLVAIAPFAMVVLIVLIVVFANYQMRRLKSRERLAAIEKGLVLPEQEAQAGSADPRRAAAKTRLTAIKLIAVGIGIALAFALLSWIVQQRQVLSVAAFAIIPLAVGIGMLIDYRLQSRRLDAAQN